MVEEDHHHQQHKLNGVAEPENVTREDDDDVAAAQRRSMGVAAEAVHHHNIEPLTILPAVLPSSSCSSSSTTWVPQFTPPANPAPKPTTTRSRAKVPLEKGYSQMVWLKLLRTEPDLAGLKGKSNKRLIPITEVKQHCTEEDAWTVLRGRVYNISPYIRFHPGGRDMLMKGAGKDCTSLFSILITLLKLFFFSCVSLLYCESDSRHLNNHPCLLAEQCSYILFPVSIYCK